MKGHKVLFKLGFQSSFSVIFPIELSVTIQLRISKKNSDPFTTKIQNFIMFGCMSKMYEKFYVRPVLVLISSVVMSVALRIDFSKKAVLNRLPQ